MPHVVAGKGSTSASAPIPVEGELLPGPSNRAAELEKQWIKLLSIWTDSVFEVPGLGWRFGLDPLIGLVPIVGDAASALVSFYILSLAAHLQVPRSTLARMMLNVGIDYVVGAVPIVGNLFDFAWKANLKNAKLLERAMEMPAHERRKQSVYDWLLIAGGAVLLLALFIGSIAAAIVLAHWITGLFTAAS